MMARAAALYDALLAFVGNPQFPVVAATALLVAAGVLWGRNWYLERTNGHAGGVIVDAFTVIAPYLAGLGIIGRMLEDECRHLHARYLASVPAVQQVIETTRTTIVPQLAARSRPRVLKMHLAPAKRRESSGPVVRRGRSKPSFAGSGSIASVLPVFRWTSSS